MQNNKPHEISIIGFPKCGTSALMRALEEREGVTLLRAADSSLEVPPEELPALRDTAKNCEVLVHKFAARVFTRSRVKELFELNPDMLLVICYRDPLKSLVSWHNMHRKIADTGRNTKHFAYKEREFYSKANVEEYYQHYAKERLKYDHYIRNLLPVIPEGQLIVIAQEDLAAAKMGFADGLINLVSQGDKLKITLEQGQSHQGYADKVGAGQEVPEYVKQELEGTKRDIQDLLQAKNLKFETA